jgi:hypothetical protein
MMEISSKIKAQVSPLIELSFKGLASLFDEDQGIFTYYIKDGKRIPMPLSWSICYTAITLLGVNKACINGWQGANFIDKNKALYSLINNWKRAEEFGHLGLIQWANAECKGVYSQDITEEIGRRSSADALTHLPTTQLAWLLTGFCTTCQMLSSDEEVKELAKLYYRAISNNFNPQTGLFCHTQKKNGPFDFRSLIGNFADQIYGIFALSSYYEVFGDKRALLQAIQCADQLCSLQGSQGQWCWHYHSRAGKVVSRYPVFSVHQDGMGPMGLKKLSMVSGKDFQAPINRGLNWLFGSNELDLVMVDLDKNLIWRDIERTFPVLTTRYLSMFLAEIGFKAPIQILDSPYGLKLNHEMRPYELGWLLYAFGDQRQD